MGFKFNPLTGNFDISGSGGGGGGITWSTPVDSNIVLDSDGTYSLGTATERFDVGHFYYLNGTGTNEISMDGSVGIESEEGFVVNDYGTTQGIVFNTDVFVSIQNPTGVAAPALRFYDNNNSNFVAFKAAGTVASDVTWTLPSVDGTNGQVLQTNGSGVLSFITASGGANVTLSNLTSPTSINQALLPDSNNTRAIGSTSLRFSTVFSNAVNLANNSYLTGRNAANSADINMIRVSSSNTLQAGVSFSPATNDALTLGSSGLAWQEMYLRRNIFFDSATVGVIRWYDASANTYMEIMQSSSTPSGTTASVMRTGNTGTTQSDRALGLVTSNNATANATQTGNILVESGNKTAGTGNSGSISARSGSSAGGNTGDVSLISGNAAAGNSGNLILQTGTASATRGYIQFNSLVAVLPTGTSDPSTSYPDGSSYYNTSTNQLRVLNGGTWRGITLT